MYVCMALFMSMTIFLTSMHSNLKFKKRSITKTKKMHVHVYDRKLAPCNVLMPYVLVHRVSFGRNF